ncbi:hypothetical protein XENOCAPTIV_011362 [Xenoophorus captivus]|uniref:Uncharacterized protein n=1 Tax=Xenoophorus captivus TaxID=1517983 RepID=A0ABV0Q4V8_9TELE
MSPQPVSPAGWTPSSSQASEHSSGQPNIPARSSWFHRDGCNEKICPPAAHFSQMGFYFPAGFSANVSLTQSHVNVSLSHCFSSAAICSVHIFCLSQQLSKMA